MQVILKDDVENLGRMGDVKDVAPGYARNYLIPRDLVIVATDRQVARVKHEKRLIEARVAERRTESSAAAAKLKNSPVTLSVKAGEGGRLFGSVTSRDVAEALTAAGFSVDRRSVKMDGPLKSLGSHEVEIDLGYGVHATATVNVVANGESAPQAAVDTGSDEVVADEMEEAAPEQ
ncbi:MAG: 50S ribosomal protein L9 [Nitrospirota bacterium]|nr:50S ribosomal protein L9 [Nitrospirota bacterium]